MDIQEVINTLKNYKGKTLSTDKACWFWRIQIDTYNLINRNIIEEIILEGETFYKIL
jgi:hypothetical protein